MKAYLSFPDTSSDPVGFSGPSIRTAKRESNRLQNSVHHSIDDTDPAVVANDPERPFSMPFNRLIGHKTVMEYVSKTYQF